MDNDEQRLIRIETEAAHQGNQIRDLSDMVEQQWRDIDRMKKQLRAALDKVADMENAQGDKTASSADIAAADKPPHY